MGNVFLRRLSRWQAETERDDFADLYTECYRDAPGTQPLTRQEFIERFSEDVQQPEFDMLVANDPTLAGCAYGFRVDRDSRWWEQFQGIPTEIDELTASRQIFTVAGLMVLPRQRHKGVASKLQDRLLDRANAAVAITVIEPGNEAARAAYQKWGWAKAGELNPHADIPPLEAWARCL
ncbi:hypothetical protein GCM10009716_08730 [Streptomyces sodiiphilus]|uniref:N-acetyltransferase domain-containing protein n=1 Tax=Streptomyces sodiiphilus TaxID=226217 RepID=A0ABN2NTH9_9ACTN